MLIKFQIEKFVCLHRALRAIRYFELFKIRLKHMIDFLNPDVPVNFMWGYSQYYIHVYCS